MVGYAVIDNEELVRYGVFKTPSSKNVMKRISYIIEFLDDLLHEYNSNIVVGLEDTQESGMNTNTFQLLTKVLGAIEFWLYTENISYMVCHISSWRKHSGIKGKRRKEKKANAIKAVKEKFGINAEEDAAEAILIAYYVKHQTQTNEEGWSAD